MFLAPGQMQHLRLFRNFVGQVFCLCLQRQVTKCGSELFYSCLCCATITWQQIFEEALHVTVVGVLQRAIIEPRLLAEPSPESFQ